MRTLTTVFALLALVACRAEEGTSLQIMSVALPNSRCIIDAPSLETIARGHFDPRGFSIGGAPMFYSLGLNVQNNLVLAASDAVQGFSADNRRPDANDIQIVGFDVCWLRADGEGGTGAVTNFGSWDDDIPSRFRCENLPANQRTFIPANTALAAGGGVAGISVAILDRPALQSMYGGAFEPTLIPPMGLIGGWYYFTPADPVDEPRNPNWGTYPHSFIAPTIIQAQAKGRLQDGASIQSNWLVFGIDLCVGCNADACGPLLADGTTCPAGGPSAGEPRVTGGVVDFSASCLPSQELDATCVDEFSNCP